MTGTKKQIRWVCLCINAAVFIGAFILAYVRYVDIATSILSSFTPNADSMKGLAVPGLIQSSGGWQAAAGMAVFISSFGACLLLCIPFSPAKSARTSRICDLIAFLLELLSVVMHIALLSWTVSLKADAMISVRNGFLYAGPGFGCGFNLGLLFVGAILTVYLFSTSHKTGVSRMGEDYRAAAYPAENLLYTPAPDTGAVVIGLTGMYRNATFRVANGEELIFGRDAALAHVIIDRDAEKVSRKHCGVVYDSMNTQYFVTDYSSNGTYTESGERLSGNLLTALPRGSTIILGDRHNSFRLS